MSKPKTVKLATFVENPDNPYKATEADLARLKGKLERVPKGLRCMRLGYVTDHTARDGTSYLGQRVVISSNKRLRELKAIYGEKGEVPAEWFCDLTDMTPEERREFIVSANTVVGVPDAEKLLEQYDRGELAALMGEEAIEELLKHTPQNPDAYGTDFTLPDGEKSEFGEMNFVVTEKQREEINFAVSLAVYCDGFNGDENSNSNGAALALIVRDWLAAKVKEAPDLKEARQNLEKLREGLCAALKESGRKASEVDELLGTHGMAGHYFGASQFMFPTREAFEKMKTLLPLSMDYEESKKTEKLYRRAEMLAKKTQQAKERNESRC